MAMARNSGKKSKNYTHGIQYWTRRFVAQSPGATLGEVVGKVARKLGRQPSMITVRDSRSHMIRDMETLRELGMLK
jgi:hypothetical protein